MFTSYRSDQKSVARAVVLLLGVGCLVGAWSAESRADDRQEVAKIRALLGQNQLDEAVEVFEKAVEANPNSTVLPTLHLTMSSYLSRAGKHEAAGDHVADYLEYFVRRSLEAQTLPSGRMISTYTNRMTSAYEQAGKVEKGEKKLDHLIQVSRDQEGLDESLQNALVQQFEGRKALLAAKQGNGEQALKIINEQVEAARQQMAERAGDADHALAFVAALDLKMELLEEIEVEGTEALQTEKHEVLEKLYAGADSDPKVVSAYMTASFGQLAQLSRSNPQEAQKLLEGLQAKIEKLAKSDDAALKAMAQSFTRSVTTYKRRIETGLKHQQLVGKPYEPLAPHVDAWVNGDALSTEDLQGKVVLLDFWAVWCGPCIATFPHLRKWHDQYADQGLVIIGVTRHYSYGWDDEAKRPKRMENLAPNEEHAAMKQFAQHHDLEHRFAVVKEGSDFHQQYGVTGIPQAVLIDREGKVRMIRVGSGDANAHDLEALIEQLVQ